MSLKQFVEIKFFHTVQFNFIMWRQEKKYPTFVKKNVLS